jgi:hypothetical protein
MGGASHRGFAPIRLRRTAPPEFTPDIKAVCQTRGKRPVHMNSSLIPAPIERAVAEKHKPPRGFKPKTVCLASFFGYTPQGEDGTG